MARGFPCGCQNSACLGPPPGTIKRQRERQCENFRRLATQKLASGSEGVSSVTTHPSTMPDSSINDNDNGSGDSSSLISSTSGTNGQRLFGQQSPSPAPDGASGGPERRTTWRTGQLVSAPEGGEVTTQVGPAPDLAVPSGDNSPVEPLAGCSALPALKVMSMDDSVEVRMRQIVHLLEQNCPQGLVRNAGTLNLRKLASSSHVQDKDKTWPRLHAAKPDFEDITHHHRGLQDAPCYSSESLASTVLKELEGRRGSDSTMQEPAVHHEAVGTLDDSFDESACSASALSSRNDSKQETDTSTLVSGNAVAQQNGSFSERFVAPSQSDGTERKGVINPGSPASIPGEREKGIGSDQQTAGRSTSNVTGIPDPLSRVDRFRTGKVSALRGRFEPPPTSPEVLRPKQGQVSQRTVQLDTPPASEIDSDKYPQPGQRGAGRVDTDRQGQIPLKSCSAGVQLTTDGRNSEAAKKTGGSGSALFQPHTQFTRCHAQGGGVKTESSLAQAIPGHARFWHHVNNSAGPEHSLPDSDLGVWDAVEEATENRDLHDFYQCATSELTDSQQLRGMFQRAVIADVRAREEIGRQLDAYSDMLSRLEEIRQKRQGTGHHSDAKEDNPTAATMTPPPPPPPPPPPHSDSPPTLSNRFLSVSASSRVVVSEATGLLNQTQELLTSPRSPPSPRTPSSVVDPQVTGLLNQTQELCEEMLVFTRVYLMCALYLHSFSKLTSPESRAKAVTVMRDVIMMSEWTSLQAWQLLSRVEESRVRTHPGGDGRGQASGGTDQMEETVTLMKAFLETA